MSGLIVEDIADGDACWTIVDDVLWKQIQDIQAAMPEPYPAGKFAGWVGALTCEDDSVAWPEGCPPRAGRILRQFFTQTHAIERESLTDIVGILTLP